MLRDNDKCMCWYFVYVDDHAMSIMHRRYLANYVTEAAESGVRNSRPRHWKNRAVVVVKIVPTLLFYYLFEMQ